MLRSPKKTAASAGPRRAQGRRIFRDWVTVRFEFAYHPPASSPRKRDHTPRIFESRAVLRRLPYATNAAVYGPPLSRGRPVERWCLRRRLVPREFGLVQLELLGDRFCDAGARAQALVIGFHCGPFRQLDRRRRHGPVDDSDEISVGDAEMVEQEFATFKIFLEIVEPRQAFAEDIGLHLRRSFLVEHRHA